MLTINEYKKNPCRMLPIPYWKFKTINTPDNMKIVHEKEFDSSYLVEYDDVEYFRLYHPLVDIGKVNLTDIRIETVKPSDIPIIVDVINKSYTDLSVTKEQILEYTKTKVYLEELWILAIENETNIVLGCGIADYDKEVKEGMLEWIQVLPQYRRRKIGQLIVNALLFKMREIAIFATVSGKIDNPTSPEYLYRKCGFIGNDIWHILYKK